MQIHTTNELKGWLRKHCFVTFSDDEMFKNGIILFAFRGSDSLLISNTKDKMSFRNYFHSTGWPLLICHQQPLLLFVDASNDESSIQRLSEEGWIPVNPEIFELDEEYAEEYRNHTLRHYVPKQLNTEDKIDDNRNPNNRMD